jgi:hypothetical protein
VGFENQRKRTVSYLFRIWNKFSTNLCINKEKIGRKIAVDVICVIYVNTSYAQIDPIQTPITRNSVQRSFEFVTTVVKQPKSLDISGCYLISFQRGVITRFSPSTYCMVTVRGISPVVFRTECDKALDSTEYTQKFLSLTSHPDIQRCWSSLIH